MRFKDLKVHGHITRDLLLLLAIGGLFALSTALSNTFVNIFLWKQSGQITAIAIYNLSIVVMQPIAFMIAGLLAKKMDRVIVLRIGVILLSAYYISVLLIGSNANQFLLFLGGLLGLGLGFYWLAFNVLTFEVTEPETRDFFNGFLGLLSSFSGMVGPFSAGFLISRMDKQFGYQTIFGISLFLFIAAVLITAYLSRRKAEGKYQLGKIWHERQKDKAWRKLLSAHFCQGLREGTFLFVIILWVYMSAKSEMALGTFGLVQSAISFAGYYFVSRHLKISQRKKGIFYGGLLLFISPFLLLMHLTFPLLLTYGILVSIAYPLLLVPYVSITYDIIGKCKDVSIKRIEYIVIRELYLNGGRISSILVFIAVVYISKDPGAITWLLPVLGAGHFLIYFFLKDVAFASGGTRKTNDALSEIQPEGNIGTNK